MRVRGRARCAPALLVGFLFALPAGAEAEQESAEALFVRARSLMKTGDCVNALPLLERSHAMDPAVGTRFNMALCEGRTGKLVQAREHLSSVIDGSAANDDRRAHAERALRELLPRIPRVVLELDEALDQIEVVHLDGVRVDGLRPNEPFAINPGRHEIEITLRNQPRQVRRFTVAERETYTWSLAGAATKPTSASQDVSNDAATGDANRASDRAQGEPSATWTTRRTAAVVAGGVSLASFGVATGFAISARSIYASSDCGSDDLCSDDGIRTRERAREHGNIATVAATVGLASALAAGTLWLTGGPSSPDRSPAPQVLVRGNVSVGRARGGGIVLEGSY